MRGDDEYVKLAVPECVVRRGTCVCSLICVSCETLSGRVFVSQQKMSSVFCVECFSTFYS